MATPGVKHGAKEQAQERRVKAFELRKAGLSYREIGKALLVSYAQAERDVSTVMKELAATTLREAETYRIMATARLDKAQSALWKSVLEGSPRAIEVLVKLEERRAKMWGYDAPTKIAPTDPTGVMMYDAASGLTDNERAERVTQILQAAAASAVSSSSSSASAFVSEDIGNANDPGKPFPGDERRTGLADGYGE